MPASIKALLVSVLLVFIAGPANALGFDSLEVDRSSCLSASDQDAPKLDENGKVIIPPEEEEEEEDEEPDCD